MDREQHGRAVYEVDWTGQGYEQLAQQMRDFLALKRQVDAEIKRGLSHGPAPSGIVGAGGQPIMSAQRQADFAQQQQAQAQERAHQQQQRTERRQQQQEERTARQEETRYRQAERAARQSDLRSERLHNQTVPNVFGAFQDTSGLTTDKDWQQYHQAIQTRYQTALKNNEELNQADKHLLSRANAVARTMEHGAGHAEGHAGLNQVINALGWLPGIPPEVYYGQMALGEMGLGLGPMGVAAGLGVGALGALGLGVYNTTASQLQMARMLAGISAGGSGTVVTPADKALADNLTQIGAGFGLTRQQTFGLLPTAAQYNLGSPAAIQKSIRGGLTLAAQGQLTNDQGVSLMSLLASRNGGDVQAAERQITALDGAIVQMGADTHTVYNSMLQDGAALRSGTNLGGFATVAAALQGSGLGPMDLIGGAIQSSGTQRMVQAAVLGMSESSYITLQKDPAGLARAVQGYAQRLMRETNSPGATESVLEAQGFITNPQNADEVLQQMLAGNFKNPPKLAGPPAPPGLQTQAFTTATVQAMTVNSLALPWQSQLGLAGQGLMNNITDAANQPLTGVPAALLNLFGALPGAAGAASHTGPATLSGVGWLADQLGASAQAVGQVSGLNWLAGQIATKADAVEHVIDITLHLPDGTAQTVTYSTSGRTTQTPSTVPGQGPSRSISVRPASTPNSTNANGR